MEQSAHFCSDCIFTDHLPVRAENILMQINQSLNQFTSFSCDNIDVSETFVIYYSNYVKY